MQTSAHSHSSPQLLQWSGTLIHAAQARTAVLDGEHTVPVLCMDIELDNPLRNIMHVEQPFPADQFKQAESAARRLKKGMHVTVDAPPLDLRFTARNVTHIHIIPEPATDLFQEKAA